MNINTYKNYLNYTNDEMEALGLSFREMNNHRRNLADNQHAELVRRISSRIDDFRECYEFSYDYYNSASDFISGISSLLNIKESDANDRAILDDIIKILEYTDITLQKITDEIDEDESKHAEILEELRLDGEYRANFDMYEFEDYIRNMDPIDAFNAGKFSHEFYQGDPYFYVNEYGNFESTDEAFEFWDDVENTALIYFGEHRGDYIDEYLDDLEYEAQSENKNAFAVLDRETIAEIMQKIYK